MIPAAKQELVDSHCHIDLYKDPISIITSGETRRIHTIAVTNAPAFFDHTFKLLSQCKYTYPSVGFHPELVPSRLNEIELMWPALEKTRFIGEVGLDFTVKDATIRKMQLEVFSQILERSACFGDKVLSVHSRRASADVLDLIDSGFPGTIILHWFSGRQVDVRKAVASGFYFSVNPSMSISKNGQDIIRSIPVDRFLTETDGPFVEIHGQPAQPEDAMQVLDVVARIWKTSIDHVAETILANFTRILRNKSSGIAGSDSMKVENRT